MNENETIANKIVGTLTKGNRCETIGNLFNDEKMNIRQVAKILNNDVIITVQNGAKILINIKEARIAKIFDNESLISLKISFFINEFFSFKQNINIITIFRNMHNIDKIADISYNLNQHHTKSSNYNDITNALSKGLNKFKMMMMNTILKKKYKT